MAATSKTSWKLAQDMLQGVAYDLVNDNLKIILLGSGFSYDPETQGTYGDIQASEIAEGNGYIAGGQSLANKSIIMSGGEAVVRADNVLWYASGGDFPPVCAAAVYDDTSADKTIISVIEFGQDYNVTDGTVLIINLEDGIVSNLANYTGA